MTQQFTFKKVVVGYSFLWLTLLAVQSYVLIDLGVAPLMAFLDSLICMSLFFGVSVIQFFTLKYYQPTENNFFYLRIWAILLSIGSVTVSYKILNYIFDGMVQYQSFLEKSLTLRFVFNVLLGGIISLILWMLNMYSEEYSFQEREQELNKAAKDAELFNLRQQLQPHFLFNSLNSISALAGSKPEQARKMIQQLSDFLRHTLRRDDKQLLTLEEELTQLDLYLEIEKVRFGHRLQTEISYEQPCAQMKLPPLILQPLVENAIKFGLYDTLDAVMIKVHAQCHEKQLLQIVISNPFEPETSGRVGGTGFGLDSVRRRLYLMYGRNDLIETQVEGNNFVAKVSVPQVNN